MNFLLSPRVFLGLVTITAAISLTSCKTGWDPEGTNSEDYIYYIGPGSKWEIRLEKDDSETEETENSFRLTRRNSHNSDVVETISGTYERHSSGFTELTVSSATNKDSTEDNLTLVEVSDDYAFMLPVHTSSNQIIAMIKKDDCPENTTESNWIRYKRPITGQATETDPMDFGIFSYSTSSDKITIKERHTIDELSGESPGDITLDSGSCSKGFAFSSNGTHYLSSIEGGILDLFNDNASEQQFLFGIEVFELSANTDFDSSKKYVGMIYDGGNSRSYPVAASCSSGDCEIAELVEIDSQTNTDNTNDQITLEMNDDVNEPADGFVAGKVSLDNGSNTEDIVCMFNEDPKNMLICVGKSPANNAEPINIFLAIVN